MSRTTYLWFVHDSCGTQKAAFTVKHEMITWLTDQHTDGWIAVRWRDGRPQQRYPAKAFPVKELLG